MMKRWCMQQAAAQFLWHKVLCNETLSPSVPLQATAMNCVP